MDLSVATRSTRARVQRDRRVTWLEYRLGLIRAAQTDSMESPIFNFTFLIFN
jgi:hypothetical protein